ncbi:MAG TPA: TetR/AcrR family transcriptional regulator [Anaeromyxobacteraceae bacterium]|nr:TetR/AcrR family transcriptional regulator [Anaeromyxobacteraceae bacterium]
MATSSTRTTPPRAAARRRTGGRSARVVEHVLEATLDEMARVGYGALSFDSVAARAGVSRTTVYRRWPTKPDLVRAAVLAQEQDEPLAPDTGSVRDDLLELVARTSSEASARDVALIRGVMAAGTDPEVGALTRFARAHRQERSFAIVHRAIERGELPHGTPPQLVIEPVLTVAYFRLCVFGEVMPREQVEALVDVVLAGARARAGKPPPSAAR